MAPANHRRAAFKARILAAITDRDGAELPRAEYVAVLEELADELEVRLSAARRDQEFEDAQTPVQDEDDA